MTKRVCSTPGCPTLVEAGARGGRCDDCERGHDRARGTRQERGYDTTYDQVRRSYQRRMDAGETFWCWRCPELGKPPHSIDPKHWHLGHANDDRSIIRGPQCPDTNLDTSEQRRIS